MNDIFRDMQANVGCDYLSDLPSYKRKVWQKMKRLNPADYEERQLEDFSKYVFGMPYQTLVKLHFMKSNNLSDELQVEANSRSLIIDAKTLRLYFGIEYSNNMGDILCQFTKQLGEIIPNTVPNIVSDIERKAMVNSLSISDSENPNKIYCNKVKRNPNSGKRSEFNADKTKLLRGSLFKHFCNEPNVSFCYFAEPSMENDDATILKNFSK